MVRMIYTGIVLKYVIMIFMIIDELGLCDTGSTISGASGLCTQGKAESMHGNSRNLPRSNEVLAEFNNGK